jgi:hypothetical protein
MGNDEQVGSTTEPGYLDEIDEDRDEPKITACSWDGTKTRNGSEPGGGYAHVNDLRTRRDETRRHGRLNLDEEEEFTSSIPARNQTGSTSVGLLCYIVFAIQRLGASTRRTLIRLGSSES